MRICLFLETNLPCKKKIGHSQPSTPSHFRPFLHCIKPSFESHLKFPSRGTMGQRILVRYSLTNTHTNPQKSVILVSYYAAEATNKLYSRTQSGQSCSIIKFSVVSRCSGRTSTDWARGRLFLKLFCLHGIWNRAFRSIIMEFSCCSITLATRKVSPEKVSVPWRHLNDDLHLNISWIELKAMKPYLEFCMRSLILRIVVWQMRNLQGEGRGS